VLYLRKLRYESPLMIVVKRFGIRKKKAKVSYIEYFYNSLTGTVSKEEYTKTKSDYRNYIAINKRG